MNEKWLPSGRARVCGVIGNPVGHSLSPLMHNFYARALGLDFMYVPCLVDNHRVEDAVKGAWALGFAGLNVTVPHKQRVMPFMRELDDSAAGIGAVNTLVRMEDGYKGYNTDAAGLLRLMTEHGIAIGGRHCLLLGAGGAAKAAAYLLMKEGAASITVLNRTLPRAQALAEEMNRRFGKETMQAAALADWTRLERDDYLAVQTTSVGMYPDTDRAPVEDPAFYRKIAAAVDAVYTPARTRFMEYTEQAGGQAVNGLDMLIYQGVAAFELWNPGIRVPDEIIAQSRQKMIRALER